MTMPVIDYILRRARNDVLPWGPCWLSAALTIGKTV